MFPARLMVGLTILIQRVGLILLVPIIAFVVVVTAEILGDLVARAGAPAIWPAVALAMAWVLLRKFGGQPQTFRLGSEGA